MKDEVVERASEQQAGAQAAATAVEPRPGMLDNAARTLGGRLLQRKLARRLALRAQRAPGAEPAAGGEAAAPGSPDAGEATLAAASSGLTGAAQPLPHLGAIQAAFGDHDVRGVQAHVGGAAATASDRLGAEAYATGGQVAFRDAPSLHTAAHEAAHVVQQRAGVQLAGGVGEEGDPFEQHADRVADAVVAGRPAAPLLDEVAPARGAEGGAAQVTQRKAASHPTLSWGSVGREVKKLQQRLNARGTEPPLKIDGAFGPKTDAAVRDFQRSVPIKDDGVVGHDTWAALDAAHEAPDIDPAQEELDKHVADKMTHANVDPHTLDQGIHYDYNYEQLCKDSGEPGRWKEDYRAGYADPQYFDRVAWMDWVLKPRMSAAAGIKSWLRGLTIAECMTTVVAGEIDALRAALGDAKFDEHYGSTDMEVPAAQRLRIRQGVEGTPVQGKMTSTAVGAAAAAGKPLSGAGLDKQLKPGEWYYFFNHPKYLLKHPGGAWQGENALFMGFDAAGNRLWSGLGAHNVTEEQMYEEMIEDYNRPRDRRDMESLTQMGALRPDGTYADKRYDPDGGEFSDTVDKNRILNDPPYTIGDTERKGGFVPTAGQHLDATRVQAEKAAP